MWVVKLVKPPFLYTFPAGFFPRKLYYKKDAQILQREVAGRGGEAVVEKVKK